MPNIERFDFKETVFYSRKINRFKSALDRGKVKRTSEEKSKTVLYVLFFNDSLYFIYIVV